MCICGQHHLILKSLKQLQSHGQFHKFVKHKILNIFLDEFHNGLLHLYSLYNDFILAFFRYIEEKFLKNPGDFLVSRDPTNKFILSVKTKEPGNPCAHFIVEFTETQLVRNDRNYYHRLVGTVPQSNTVQGLIQKYKDSQVSDRFFFIL